MCQAVVPDLFHDSEQRVLPSVHQRGRHHQHHASHMTKSHDTHAHDWLKGKWRRSHGKYKKIKTDVNNGQGEKSTTKSQTK